MLSRSANRCSCSARAAFVLLVGLIVMVAAGKAILFDTLDPDCFWHLRVADQLRADGIGPIVDRLSFGSVQTPWTPYSWLAELAMSWLWTHAGWRSAVAVQALMQGAFVALVAWAAHSSAGTRRTGRLSPAAGDVENAGEQENAPVAANQAVRSSLSSAVATAFAAFLSLPYLSFRPVTAALVLLALCAALIVRDRRLGERSRAVWLIVPITALIVNLHLYAIFIPLWMLALLAGAVWERRGSTYDRPEAERRISRYGYLMVATIAACLLTPMLPGVIASTLRYQFADPMVAGNFIAEMRPFFRGTMGHISAALVGLFGLCVLIHHRRLRAGEWVWLLLSGVLLFRLGRFAPVFAIVAAPMFASTLPRLSDRLLARPAIVLAMTMVLALGMVRLAIAFPSSTTTLSAWLNRHGPGAPGYPCAAAEYVSRDLHPLRGRVINEFDWGGYLEWQLGPAYQPLLDGRTQLFTPDFWHATYLGNEEDRKRFLATIRADAAILPAKDSRFHDALCALGWRSAFRDEHAEVLLPPIDQPDPKWAPAAMLLGD